MRPVMSSVAAVAAFEAELAAREQRREVLEQDLVLARFQRLAVDRVDHGQGEVALAVLRPADAAGQVVAGTQVEAADLAGRDVDVVRAGQVAGLGGAKEAEAVREDFQHAVGGHALAVAGEHLQDREDHVLLAGAGDAFLDLQLVGHVQELRRGHPLEVAQRVQREAFRDLRVRARNEGLAVAAIVLHAAILVALALAIAAVAEAVATVAAPAFGIVVAAFARVAFATLAGAFASGRGLARGNDRRRGLRLRRGCALGSGLGGRGGCGSVVGGLAHACLAHALLGGFAGIGGVIGQAGNPR